MFHKFYCDFDHNLFDELSTTSSFENITKGRKGGNLIDYKDELVPIVRTTSIYQNPPQQFLKIHYDIINQIKSISKIPNINFNNAMIEMYDELYTSMGYHTDQSLDLQDDSYICIFSCYNNETKDDVRTLDIKNKITNKTQSIILEHNSIVIFSTETNRNHLHKIILEKVTTNKKWLGITFRLSKTYIKFINEIPYFYNTNEILKIATDKEKQEFMKMKGCENKLIEYKYPKINYTISNSDLIMIK